MKNEKNNLEIWDRNSKTNPKYTKQVNFGRKFTTINANYQMMMVTQEFGSIGKGFGIDEEDFRFIDVKGDSLLIYTARFWYEKNDCIHSFPMHSSINTHTKRGLDEDCMKKVATDAFTKAISKLGFSADVFLGMYDDNKYVSDVEQEFKEIEVLTPEILKVMLDWIEKGKGKSVKERLPNYQITKAQMTKLEKAFNKDKAVAEPVKKNGKND